MKKLVLRHFALFVVIITVACNGIAGAPTAPTPIATSTPDPFSLGVKVGEILNFTLNPLPASGVPTGGVGGEIIPTVSAGFVNIRFTKLTGKVIVTLHFYQNNSSGPKVGESFEISEPGVATIAVLATVNDVTVRNMSSVVVTGNATIYHKP